MLGNFTSMNDVILSVQDMTGMSWAGEQPVWETWAKDAMTRIHGKKQWADKFELLDIEDNCTIELCKDTVGVPGLLLGDRLDKCNNVFSQCGSSSLRIPDFIPGDNEFGNGYLVVSHGSISVVSSHPKWKIHRGNIIFQQEVDEDKATLWLKKFLRDDDGQLMVPVTDVVACAAFICRNMAVRSRWGSKEQRMTFQDVQYWEGRWATEMGNARAEQAQMSESRKEELRNLMTYQGRYGFTRPE